MTSQDSVLPWHMNWIPMHLTLSLLSHRGRGLEVRGDTDRMPLAREIASALKNAQRPVIVSGTGCMNQAVIEAAANVAWALCSIGKQADLCYTSS